MNFLKACTLLPLLIQVQGHSFPFDLSAIENDEVIIQPKYLVSTEPARPIGVASSAISSEPVSDKPCETVPDTILHTIVPTIVPSISDVISTIGVKRKAPATKSLPVVEAKIRNLARTKNFKTLISDINPKLSHAQIIENEVNFKTESYSEKDREYFCRMMTLISEKDKQGLRGFEPTFKEHFRIKKLSLFEKNGIKNYFIVPAILFGFWDIIDHTGIDIKHYKALHQITDLLMIYLISTESFEVVFKTIARLYPQEMAADMRQDVIALIKRKNPTLNFYEEFCLNFIGIGFHPHSLKDVVFEIIGNNKSEAQKVEMISLMSEVIIQSHQHLRDEYLRIPLEKPELFLALSDNLKFNFLKISLLNDEVDVLISVLNVDPGLVNYYDKNGWRSDNSPNATIYLNAKNCFNFIIDTFPELLESFELSPVKIVFDRTNVEFMAILEEKQLINPELILKITKEDDHVTEITLLEYLLQNGSRYSCKHIASKINYTVLSRICSNPRSIFRSDQQTHLLYKLLAFFGIDVFTDATKVLGIDLDKQKFNLFMLEGNGALFLVGRTSIVEDCQKLGISTAGPFYQLEFGSYVNGQRKQVDINYLKTNYADLYTFS